MDTTSQKVAFNTIIQVISKAVTVAFSLLSTILLTRYLGKAGFGDYIFVITYVTMFGALADWGTAMIGIREAAANTEKQGRIFGNLFLIRLAFSLIAAVSALVIIGFIPLQSSDSALVKNCVLLASILVLLFATKASFGIVFQTKLRMEKLAIVDMTISLISLLLSLTAIFMGWGLPALILSIVVANIIGLIIAIVLANRVAPLDMRLDISLIKGLVGESLPMGAVLILFSVYNKIDTVILASIKGNEAVGIYGVAYRIHDVVVLGASYFMQSLLPVLAKEVDPANLGNQFRKVFQKAFDILALMALFLLASVQIFAPLMVKIIGGSEFSASVPVLRILIFATFIAYFNHLTGYTIVVLKKQRLYVLISLVALVFNVILNLILIPKYSYKAAAATTILTEGFVFILTMIYVKKLIGYFPKLTTFPKTAIELIRNRAKIL